MKNYTAEQTKILINKALAGMWTNCTAFIVSYDKDEQTAKIQLSLKIDGEIPPIIVRVPVQHIGGDWCTVTQIDKGCEGVAHFSSRAIGKWFLTGKILDPSSPRKFSIDDAFFSPGTRSLPNVLTNVENNGVQLRNKDGSQYIWLKNDGNAYISGNLFVGGKTTLNGGVDAKESATLDGENLTKVSHTHIDAEGRPTGDAQE